MALSDFQKELLTSANVSELYKQMQNDATFLKDAFERMRLRYSKYAKISGTDASTHLGIPSEIVTTLANFRAMLNELVQIYDGDITSVTATPAPIVEDMYSIIR